MSFDDLGLPFRLRRALEGLVKAGILTYTEVETVIGSARRHGTTSGARPRDAWVDLLWDEIAEIRAASEARRAKAAKLRKYKNKPQS